MNCTTGNKTQLYRFIQSVNDYYSRPSENSLSHLQRQLQLLSVEDDLTIFEPNCSTTLEFFLCFDQLLKWDEAESPLAWKTVTLLLHLIKCEAALITLRDEIQIIPSIVDIVLTDGIAKEKYSKALFLIKSLSNGIKINRINDWVLRLLTHLKQSVVTTLSNGQGSAAVVVCDSDTVVSLEIIASLCRDNSVVLHCLKNWTNDNRQLLALLPQASGRHLQLLSLEISLLLLYGGSGDNATLIIKQQGRNVLPLVLAACQQAVSEGDPNAVQLAADVLRSLSALPVIKSSIASTCEAASRELENAIQSLKKCPILCRAGASTFLATLVNLQLPILSAYYMDILQLAVSWCAECSCNNTSVRCLQLLNSLASAPTLEKLVNGQLQQFASAAKGHLQLNSTSISIDRLQLVIEALQLFEALTTKDTVSITPGPALPLSLRLGLPPETLAALLSPLSELHVHLLHSSAVVDQQKRATHSKFCLADGISAFSPVAASTLLENTGASVITCGFNGGHNALLCSEAVVRLLVLVKALATQDNQYKLLLAELLERPSVMPHVVYCLRCSRQQLVRLATRLLFDEMLPGASLDIFVGCTHKDNSVRSDYMAPSAKNSSFISNNTVSDYNMDVSEGSTEVLEGGFSSACDRCLFPSDSALSLISRDSALSEKADKVLTSLKGITSSTKMDELPLADVVDLYEYKISTMSESERTQQQLLRMAEGRNRELNRALLHARVESTRVRLLLRRWEQRLTAEREQHRDAVALNAELQEQARQFRDNISKEKIAVDRECSKLRKKLSDLNSALQEKSESVAKLTRQHKDAAEKIKEFERGLEQERNEKITLQKEIESQQKALEKLRTEYDNLQAKCVSVEMSSNNLKLENTKLEKVIRDLERTVSDRDTRIEGLSKENESLQRLRDMIHNISSGKSLV